MFWRGLKKKTEQPSSPPAAEIKPQDIELDNIQLETSEPIEAELVEVEEVEPVKETKPATPPGAYEAVVISANVPPAISELLDKLVAAAPGRPPSTPSAALHEFAESALKPVKEKPVSPATQEKPQTSRPPRYYALYVYDSTYHAVGPFDDEKIARAWLSGFAKGVEDNDDFNVLGVVTNLIKFNAVEYEEPEWGDDL